jgi:predicted RNase H-like nuclease (RuvC/YqgF family)
LTQSLTAKDEHIEKLEKKIALLASELRNKDEMIASLNKKIDEL